MNGRNAPMRISLRAGERVYINGAVLRARGKTTIELLNDATFLLEGHVLQPEDATTPLKQLYFALQTLLIEPSSKSAWDVFKRMHTATCDTFSTTDIVMGLRNVARLVESGRTFEALKTIRGLFEVEEQILGAVHKAEAA
jgi:flagellar protein FlbT